MCSKILHGILAKNIDLQLVGHFRDPFLKTGVVNMGSFPITGKMLLVQ